MKKYEKPDVLPLRLCMVILCFPVFCSGHGVLSVNICEIPALSEWCKFFDKVLHGCGSFCFNKTYHFKFKDWQLCSPALLSSSFYIDREESSRPHVVNGALFSRSLPTPFFTSTQLAGLSEDVIVNVLDMEIEDVQASRLFTEFVSGRSIYGTDFPLWHRYGGHQFGIWAGQLGDGRAHLIGEYVSHRDGSLWELQLKGSGKTPYSRDGDGRAVLHSSVREFLASEAMYHLGIPTTRAAALVVSSDLVKRDKFYNGKVRKERTAVVLRLAPSWFRIGSFELLARNNEIDLLKQLSDFVIKYYFSELSPTVNNRYAHFFEAVIRRVAVTTALWQSVGFAHGVLNTDNVSILGLTVDYGPFRFADEFDENMTPNFSDDEHRYSYRQQPAVMEENLRHLLTALSSLMTADEYGNAEDALKSYKAIYRQEYMRAFRPKVGLSTITKNADDDEMLISQLLSIMSDQKADFTATFRQLSDISLRALIKLKSKDVEHLPWALQQLMQHPSFSRWLTRYAKHLKKAGVSESERRSVMQRANPHYVLRNWMAQQAIDRAEDSDFSTIHSIQTILRRPFVKQAVAELMGYSSRPPLWSRNLTVSCSS